MYRRIDGGMCRREERMSKMWRLHVHRWRKKWPVVIPEPMGFLDEYGAEGYIHLLHYVWKCRCGARRVCKGTKFGPNMKG